MKRIVLSVCVAVAAAVVARAETYTWNAGTNGNWEDAANWSVGGGEATAAPSAEDDVFLPVSADATNDYTVTANGPIDVASLSVGSDGTTSGFKAIFTSKTNAMHHVAGELIVYAGGKMTHTALPGTANAAKDECYKLNVTAQSITIKTGGMIDVSARGYAGAKGPGTSPGRDGGTVASHGGAMDVGKSYGSLHSPTNCGSGSSSSSGGNSRGGGAVRLLALGDIAVESGAAIRADGEPRPAGSKSSGAGGSVWLCCATLKGAGTISVSAQDPTYGMGGCGGRIAVWQSEGTDFTTAWTGKMQAVSGCGSTTDAGRTRGGPGTTYLQAKDESVTNATVIIDNADKIHGTATSVYGKHWNPSIGIVVVNGFVELCARTGSDKIGNLIVRKKAHAMVPSGGTLQVYGNIDTTGGYTYTVGGTVQMCGPETATISGSAPYANFVCTEPGKTLLFGTTANDCFEISAEGLLTLTGTEENPVNLFPAGDDPTKAWAMKFGVDAVSDINYASVSNSNASAGATAVTAYFSNDLGGNSKWAFTTPAVEGETITWTGAMNDDWTEPANWDRGRMVKDTDVVVIPSEWGSETITNMPKISAGNITLNALTVEDGATLTLNGTPSLMVTNALAVAGALVVASKVKITCTKNVSFEGGSFAAGDSIFLLTENDDQSVNLNNQHFKNLTIRKESGGVIFSEGWEADVFDCASANALDLTFAAGKTYKAEECGFRGRRADGGQALTLRSSTPESAWNLALGSAQYIAGVDVQDSTATLAAAVVDSSSRNSGRNVNWTFSNTGVTNAFWTGGTGNFNTSGSWDTGVVPDANTRVFVWASPGETKAVTASSAVTVRDLVLLGTDTGKAGLTATKSLTVLGDVDVSANATLTVADPEGNTVNGDVVVRAGGKITQSADVAKNYKLKISVDGNLTVEKDGKIDATGCGYPANQGPGAKTWQWGRNSAAHGGGGASGEVNIDCYGSVFHPVTYGSGSEADPGGGVIRLNVDGVLTVDGSIMADGKGVGSHSSAAGGSVWITCPSLMGGGTISASGAHCICNNAGGGGRVAIEVSESDGFSGFVLADGGYCDSSNLTLDYGGAGTVYRVGPNQPALGEISIDNALIAKNNPSVAMTHIPETQLPMGDDGDAEKAYKQSALTIGRKAKVTITKSMCVGDLNFTASGSILELGTNTLTISSREHKRGKGWPSGISITSNQAPNGVWGKIVWKPQGMAIIVR